MSPAWRNVNDSSRKVIKSIKMPKEVKYRGYTKLTAEWAGYFIGKMLNAE
jgi:hypothetical protein